MPRLTLTGTGRAEVTAMVEKALRTRPSWGFAEAAWFAIGCFDGLASPARRAPLLNIAILAPLGAPAIAVKRSK